MGGFAKGLSVIEALGDEQRGMTIAEVARASGLDRASARRCLLTLVEAGYAGSDGRYFELTPRVLRLGLAYLSAPLPRLLQPHLDELAHVLKESCSAAVLDGTNVVYICRATHHRVVAPGLHAGSRLPAFCSSLGRVLLAALPVQEVREILEESNLESITDYTQTSLPALLGEIERVRSQGFSVIDQEMQLGSRSIAVPVINVTGQTVAAVTVGVQLVRADMTRLTDEILPRLLEVQSKLRTVLP